MGFRVQLIAVSGKEPRVVHRDYGVVPTGEHEEIPESPFVGALLPNGSYLLFINDRHLITPDDEVFERLSADASLIACYANETYMVSYACGWLNGTEQWSVLHDFAEGPEHLEETGTLPLELNPIRDRLTALQVGEDQADYIFDIPIELFVALGGIRYDKDIPGASPRPWEILKSRG